MSTPRPSLRTVAVLLVVGAFLTACSRSGDSLAAPDADPTTTRPASTIANETLAEPSSGATAESTSADSTPVSAAATLPSTAPPISVIEVAEVGVPGLDSDDAFCAAWSRFAGSFQVVAVTAAFGSGEPEQLAALEVAAAPTVTAAYEQLIANWPDELSSEADLVATEFLGPFARRLEIAAESLVDAGADDATIDAIEAAWLTGLAERDPTTPEFVVDLSDETWAVIDLAATGFVAQRVPFSSDPSLVTNVETPLTNEYLALSCPDQGTLSGQEVDSP